MFCRCIKLRSKTKPAKSILQDWSSSRLNRSRAPSPPERSEISIESLVVIGRDMVMEPSVETQVLENIDEIILSKSTI
jgi:hypothetical protein